MQKIKQLTFTLAKQCIFLEDLIILLEEGLSIRRAIETMARIDDGFSGKISKNILIKIQQGQHIAEGMRSWFANRIIDIIWAGEESGALVKALKFAVESLKQKKQTTVSVVKSLFYPFLIIVIGFALAILIKHLILHHAHPAIVSQQWLSREIFIFIGFIEHWWLQLLAGVSAVMSILVWVLHSYIGQGRYYLDGVPILSYYRQLVAAHFMQKLGLLISNDVKLNKALKLLRRHSNPYLASHLMIMEHRLAIGKNSIKEILDTGLINQADLMRLSAIDEERNFDYLLIRLGEQALLKSTNSIKLVSKIIGVFLFFLNALIAVLMLYETQLLI